MGFVLLAIGALMAIAGAYEMVVGGGDILSERGWSAFIAGAVFIGSGVVTAALGVVVRTVQAIVVAPRSQGTVGAVGPAIRDDFSPATPVENLPDPAMGASLEAAAHQPLPPVSPPEHGRSSADDHRIDSAPSGPVIAADTAMRPAVEIVPPPPAAVEDDWLDHSFAELEREIARQHEAPRELETAQLSRSDRDAAVREPAHQGPVHQGPAQRDEVGREQAEHVDHEPVQRESIQHESLLAEAPQHGGAEGRADRLEREDDGPTFAAPETAAARADMSAPVPAEATLDTARVAAREEPTAPVIGRYESEGTSYVMYADGSIDAQSEAGVYRFASMAELKAFIES